MSSNNHESKSPTRQSFFLGEVIRSKVMWRGKKIGSLADFVIVDGDLVADVSHIYVSRPFGDPALVIPWNRVRSLDRKETVVDIDAISNYVVDADKPLLLLKDDILDKKVLDTDGKDVDVVYDIKMTRINGKLYVSDVDISRYGFLRRIGLKWLADSLYWIANRIKPDTVPWAYVQPLPGQIGSFSGALRLKILKEKLSEMHPVDLADVLEQMEPLQATAVFTQLDTPVASDALEEIDPGAQKLILGSLTKEKIAQLVDEMTPGQAADVLAVLPQSDVRQILQFVNPQNAIKIQAILEKHEEKILDYATNNYMKFDPGMTVKEARERYGTLSNESDIIMYLYIVDSSNRILGVVDVRELMRARDDATLEQIMSGIVANLTPKSTLREASAMFSRYGFRALPILDEEGCVLGVVPYRDMMNLKHRFLE
jgi:magnesium transporter